MLSYVSLTYFLREQFAHAEDTAMQDAKGLVVVSLIIDRAGVLVPAREFAHNAKTYIEGENGLRYVIRVRNLTAARIEGVLTVDGLDTRSGKDGSLVNRGMIIEGFTSYDFDGFRLNEREVAAFRFGGADASYAAQMGKPSNVGVIGLAIFQEFVPPPPSMEYRDRVPAAPRAEAASVRPSAPPTGVSPAPLGTSFGERRESIVRSTTFVRATKDPAALIALRYESRVGLRALGIAVDAIDRDAANPFPADAGGCPPPPGWKG
jgi:hypothetical protein